MRILSVGNLTPVKGHRFLLEILSALGTPPCPLEVTLVGDGSERETLTLMAQKLPSAIKVLLVGKQEATPFFAAADLFILPSQSEGMSNALLEAMSFGLCCLATKTGGTPEILTPGTDGFLIEYGDAKGAATLLLNLLENPEARRRVGEAARKKITDLYSVPRLADGWLKLAETLLPGFTQKRRMGLVLSLFPELYETFLLRDIQALENAGYQFDFFSLKRHREEFPHPEYRRYVTKTHQSPLICGRTLLAFLQQSLRHPIRMMTILLFILYHGAMQPLEGFKTLGTLPLACYFAGILARRGLTHLHAHWHNVPSTVAFFMAQLNNIPWTLTVHGEDIYHGAPFLKGKAKHVGHVSSCAKAIDDCLRRDYLPTQVPSEVLYHGLDLDRFCPGPEPKDDPPLLLAVGRIEESKGYDILARAARQLKDQGLRFNVRVLGKGPLEVRLKALLQELDITDCFHLEGFVPQSGIVAWYRRATAFVLPCIHRYHWGIPNVTLEAMAMRLPVVVSDLPGLLEFCREGENALIVQEKDVTRTAEALRRLLTDPALCERLGQNGRATVERLFDIRKNGAALVQCFDRLLGLPENPPPLKKETL